jgi:hypothetical protein
MAVSCQFIAQAFELRGTAAKRRWDNIAELLTRAGTDPNWRRRPSVLDQLRGWKRQPVARDKNGNHHLQMVAYVDTYGYTCIAAMPSWPDFWRTPLYQSYVD